MELLIKNFLRPLINISNGNGNGNGHGYGNGDGYGNGNGHGYGYGYGYGNGHGDGYGYGHGYGYGYGNGHGHGIKTFNNKEVFLIDKVQTIIETVKKDVAKGYILKNDWTLEPCYIVRNDYAFAHGETLKEALQSLEDKYIQLIPIDERIKMFVDEFKDLTKTYKASKFYDWHYKLTGSCKMGRDNFINSKSIDLENDKMTVDTFIKLTIDEYQGNIIKQLKDKLK